ncbi:hypothetical protein RCL1_000618 [Eukaryota sp. TZLM3-RCL]
MIQLNSTLFSTVVRFAICCPQDQVLLNVRSFFFLKLVRVSSTVRALVFQIIESQLLYRHLSVDLINCQHFYSLEFNNLPHLSSPCLDVTLDTSWNLFFDSNLIRSLFIDVTNCPFAISFASFIEKICDLEFPNVQRLCIKGFPFEILLPNFLLLFPNLDTLFLENCGFDDGSEPCAEILPPNLVNLDDFVLKFEILNSKLRTLSLKMCGFSQLNISKLSNLDFLELYCCPVLIDLVGFDCLEMLTKLVIEKCDVDIIMGDRLKLQELTMIYSDLSLKDLNLRHLRSLHLRPNVWNHYDLNLFHSVTSDLRVFVLDNFQGSKLNLTKFSNISTLNLIDCSNLIGVVFPQHCKIESLKIHYCHKIEYLNYDCLDHVTNLSLTRLDSQILFQLVHSCVFLVHLQLSFILTASKFLFPHLPFMKSLLLFGCDDVLQSVTDEFPRLEKLVVRDCSVQRFSVSFPRLKFFTVNYCPTLVSVELKSTVIESISLSHCNRLSSLRLVNSLYTVQSLVVDRCNELNCVGLFSETGSFGNLNRFIFHGFMPDASFIDKLPALEYLFVSLAYTSDEAVAVFHNSLKSAEQCRTNLVALVAIN